MYTYVVGKLLYAKDLSLSFEELILHGFSVTVVWCNEGCHDQAKIYVFGSAQVPIL